MNRTMCHLILATAVLATMSGCVSHSNVSPETVTPYAELRLRFDPPREVTLRTDEGDTLILERVEEMRGRFLEASGDSLVFRTTQAAYVGGRTQRFGTGATLYVARNEVRMDTIENNRVGTVFLVVAALGLVAALVVAISKPTEHAPPPEKYEPK